MEENISERNGFMRLICGVAMTAMGTAHLSRDSKALGFTMVAAGAMKVAEGIFLYCPVKAMINSNVKGAVASTFDEYMDGETLMNAFNAAYQGSSQNGQSKSSSSSNSSGSNSTGGGIGQTVSQVAGAVSQAANAVQSATSSMSQNGSNNSQNSSKNKNNSQSVNSKNSGNSATNPS